MNSDTILLIFPNHTRRRIYDIQYAIVFFERNLSAELKKKLSDWFILGLHLLNFPLLYLFQAGIKCFVQKHKRQLPWMQHCKALQVPSHISAGVMIMLILLFVCISFWDFDHICKYEVTQTVKAVKSVTSETRSGYLLTVAPSRETALCL